MSEKRKLKFKTEEQKNIEKLQQDTEVIAIGLADSYENQLITSMKLEDETNTTLLALADAYELIMQLQAEIELLKGGNV